MPIDYKKVEELRDPQNLRNFLLQAAQDQVDNAQPPLTPSERDFIGSAPDSPMGLELDRLFRDPDFASTMTKTAGDMAQSLSNATGSDKTLIRRGGAVAALVFNGVRDFKQIKGTLPPDNPMQPQLTSIWQKEMAANSQAVKSYSDGLHALLKDQPRQKRDQGEAYDAGKSVTVPANKLRQSLPRHLRDELLATAQKECMSDRALRATIGDEAVALMNESAKANAPTPSDVSNVGSWFARLSQAIVEKFQEFKQKIQNAWGGVKAPSSDVGAAAVQDNVGASANIEPIYADLLNPSVAADIKAQRPGKYDDLGLSEYSIGTEIKRLASGRVLGECTPEAPKQVSRSAENAPPVPDRPPYSAGRLATDQNQAAKGPSAQPMESRTESANDIRRRPPAPLPKTEQGRASWQALVREGEARGPSHRQL